MLSYFFPVIVQALCDREIRLAWWLFLAFTLFCIAITVLFVRNTPEEKGEVVDGLSWSACHPLRRLDTECAPAEQTHVPTVKECYTSFPFYSLSFQLFASRSMLAAFTSYIVLYAMNSGISASSAALLISVFNGVGLFGRLFSGTIDYLHIPKRVYAAVCHMFSCSGMLLLFLARTTPAFILAAALSGLGFGMLSALFVILQSACFGRENFPLVNGTFNSLGFIGAAVSPMLVAAIMHLTGSYGNAYLVISVICLIAFLLAAATPIRLIGSRQTQTDKRRSST